MTRTRNEALAGFIGSAKLKTAYSYQTASSYPIVYIGQCKDAGDGTRDNFFEVHHTSVLGGAYTHEHYYNAARTQYKILDGYTFSYFANPTHGLVSHLNVGTPSDSYLAIELTKKVNPSRTSVNLPTFMFELRELPELVHDTGKKLIRNLAKRNLRYQFGLLPLLSDVSKLISFTDKVDARTREILSYADGERVRKRSLYENTESVDTGQYITYNSAPGWIVVSGNSISKTTSNKVWGYIRISPAPTFGDWSKDGERVRSAAQRAVGSLYLDPSTLWEAIPWSWLVDWYGNVGDWLQANRNYVPLVWGDPYICETITTIETFGITNNNCGIPAYPLSAPIQVKKVSKRRTKASSSLPSAYLPFLSGKQIGILASLAVLRSRL